jgi:hypothetical protein
MQVNWHTELRWTVANYLELGTMVVKMVVKTGFRLPR